MIGSILAAAWSARKALLIGFAVLALVAYFVILKLEVRTAHADALDARQERDAAMAEATKWRDAADQYLEANRQNEAAFAAYKKQNQEWADLAKKQIEAQARQLLLAGQIRKEIQDAPETDNRSVGPILNFTLECLRQFQTGAVACRH